jgi:hypothetical protein
MLMSTVGRVADVIGRDDDDDDSRVMFVVEITDDRPTDVAGHLTCSSDADHRENHAEQQDQQNNNESSHGKSKCIDHSLNVSPGRNVIIAEAIVRHDRFVVVFDENTRTIDLCSTRKFNDDQQSNENETVHVDFIT